MAYDPSNKEPLTEAELEAEILARNTATKRGSDLFADDRSKAVATIRELEAREGGRPAMFLDE